MKGNAESMPESLGTEHTGIGMCNNALIARDCVTSPMREEARLTPTDRLRLEDSALQYAMAVRQAMMEHRRSGKMHVVESTYTVYNMTRISRDDHSLPTVRTVKNYISGACKWVPEPHRQTEWESLDRSMFMLDLETSLPEKQLLLEDLQRLLGVTADEGMKSVKRICAAILSSSGRVPSLRRVSVVVQQLLPILVGESISWTVRAEIDGAWPESLSTRLSENTRMNQLWSVQYRSDIDALNFMMGIPWEDIPDARVTIVGRAADTDEIDSRLRVLVRVLTLFGPHRVRLVRCARSQPGTAALMPTNTASDRLGGSGHGYCIRKNQAARCRRFVEEILPLLSNRPADLARGSMIQAGAVAMDLYDDPRQQHEDPVAEVAHRVMCLENLLLDTSEKYKVTRKLETRTAAILSLLRCADPQDVTADLEVAYCIRSNFFHGHTTPDDRRSATPDLRDRIGDYCRLVISLFLQSGTDSRSQFLTRLAASTTSGEFQSALQLEIKHRQLLFPLMAAECS